MSRRTINSSLVLLLVASLVACTSGDSTADIAAADTGEVADANNFADTGMEGDGRPYFAGSRYMIENSHANVVQHIGLTGEFEPGVAQGFDLDGRASEPGDEESCRHADATGPDGTEGIDNQFARMWPTIEPLVGAQVEALLQGAINEGRVLLIVELTGVDDLQNDDSVTVNLFRGRLDPDVGASGFIVPSQTFEYDYESPISTVEGVALVDGALEAGPVELQIPLRILDLDVVFRVEQGRVRLQINEDGSMSGLLGGAINVPVVLDELYNTGARAEAELVTPMFYNNTDMEYDGESCSHLSVAFDFDATTAFVVRDRDQEAGGDATE